MDILFQLIRTGIEFYDNDIIKYVCFENKIWKIHRDLFNIYSHELIIECIKLSSFDLALIIIDNITVCNDKFYDTFETYKELFSELILEEKITSLEFMINNLKVESVYIVYLLCCSYRIYQTTGKKFSFKYLYKKCKNDDIFDKIKDILTTCNIDPNMSDVFKEIFLILDNELDKVR